MKVIFHPSKVKSSCAREQRREIIKGNKKCLNLLPVIAHVYYLQSVKAARFILPVHVITYR